MHGQQEPPLIAEEDKVFLMKKLWCHGQLLSPIMGIVTAIWSIIEYNTLLTIEFIYCIVAIILLPIWSFLSWRSMNAKWPPPSILVKCGLVLLCYYVGIGIITGKHLSHSTFTLCLFIFTILQLIETSAYLFMVKLLTPSLERQHNEELL